ncbi:MAG: MerR family transcriptional regulator [Devosiaceae bacterium]
MARASVKSPDAFRTISEAADALDLPQHVLRFWETRFSQIKPMKRSGGRRYYRPNDIALLQGIRHLLYEEGYTIKGVQRILREQGIGHVVGLAPALPSVAAKPLPTPAEPKPRTQPQPQPQSPSQPVTSAAPAPPPPAQQPPAQSYAPVEQPADHYAPPSVQPRQPPVARPDPVLAALSHAPQRSTPHNLTHPAAVSTNALRFVPDTDPQESVAPATPSPTAPVAASVPLSGHQMGALSQALQTLMDCKQTLDNARVAASATSSAPESK